MMMDWKNIKYLFQIPLEWFKTISNRVFNAHGTNFITVKHDEYGGMDIGVDEDSFSQAVLNITDGGSGGGTVKSVDGIAPDSNGDVPLGAVRSINNYYYPDSDGNIEVGLGVASVNGRPPISGDVDLGDIINTINGVGPDEYGNWEGTIVESVNGKTPISGDVDLGDIINTINGVGPDICGNWLGTIVESVNGRPPISGDVDLGDIINTINGVGPDEYGNWEGTIVESVNGKTPDENGNVEVGTVKSVNGIGPDLTGNVYLSVIQSVNKKGPDQHGNVTVGTVRSVSIGYQTLSPDAQGDLSLGRVVKSVDGVGGSSLDWDFGNLRLNAVRSVNGTSCDWTTNYNVNVGTVRSINQIGPDLSGNVSIPGLVTSVNNIQAVDGNVDLGDIVHSVDGITPDENGDVDFGLDADSWVKTDAYGYLTVADKAPLVLSNETGWMYNNNGQLSCRNDVVDLSSTQRIDGYKTFTVLTKIDGRADNDALTELYGNGIKITGNRTNVPHVQLTSETDEGRTTFYRNSYGIIYDSHGFDINAPAGKARLTNPPSAGETDTKAIATIGWSNSKYVTLSTDQRITGRKNFTQTIDLSVATDRDASSRGSTINRGINIIDSQLNTFAELRATAYSNGTNGVIMAVYKPNAVAEMPYFQLQATAAGSANASIKSDVVSMRKHTSDSDGYVQIRPGEGRMEIYPASSSNHGGYIDFHYNGNTADYTARLIDHQNDFSVIVPSGKNITLNAAANKSTLANAPTIATSDKTSKAIATCGWTNTVVGGAIDSLNLNNFLTKSGMDSSGGAASYNNLTAHYVTVDTAQTITASKRFKAGSTWKVNDNDAASTIVTNTVVQTPNVTIINTNNGLGVGGLAADGNTSIKMTSSTGNVKLQSSSGLVTLDAPSNYATLAAQPNDTSEDSLAIATCGYVQQNCGGDVETVDGLAPDDNGNIDFGLAPNSIVGTDSQGHLTTAGEGESTTRTVVKNVRWNGTQLVIESETWTFEYGILTNITTNADETISTVTYNP